MNDATHVPYEEPAPIPVAEAVPAAAASPSRWPGRILYALIILAAIPVLYRGGRSEIARWYRAASLDAVYRGERAEALAKINQAVAWDPNDLDCLTEQSGILLTLRDTKKAAEVADRALDVARKQLAMRDYRDTQMQLATALNQSAYAHALDGSELEAALASAEESIAIMARYHQRSPGVLDTRGYLHYLIAQEDESIRDAELEKALEDMEETVKLNGQIAKVTLGRIQSQAQLSVDRTPLRYMRRNMDESRAVLRQHRGLVYEAVGKSEAAEKDFAEAKRLGYDPENGIW